MWRIALVVFASHLSLSAPLAAADAVVPTAEEVQLLERLNQHRADWTAGDQRITEAVRIHEIPASDQAWNAAKAGAGHSPPLVFNPDLIRAARALLAAHEAPAASSRYDATAVMKRVGYEPGKTNLALFTSHAGSLSLAYELLMTNVIAEAPWYNGLTRPVFASTEALKPEFREAGIAVSAGTGTGAGKGSVDVVVILGNGTAKRYLGGICYLDANRDARYEPTEGKAGVVVSCGSATTTTGASGAWWLPLQRTDAAQLILTSGDLSATRAVAAGEANQQVVWRMPIRTDLTEADRLIADAQKAAAGSDDDRTRAALIRLLVGTRMKVLDDDRLQRIATLVQPVQSDFQDTLHQIESSLAEDPDEIMKRFNDQKKAWKNAMPGWFTSAEALAQTHQQLVEFLSAPAEQQDRLRPQMLSALKAGIAQPGDPSFLEQYLNWLSQVDRSRFEEIGEKTAE